MDHEGVGVTSLKPWPGKGNGQRGLRRKEKASRTVVITTSGVDPSEILASSWAKGGGQYEYAMKRVRLANEAEVKSRPPVPWRMAIS